MVSSTHTNRYETRTAFVRSDSEFHPTPGIPIVRAGVFQYTPMSGGENLGVCFTGDRDGRIEQVSSSVTGSDADQTIRVGCAPVTSETCLSEEVADRVRLEQTTSVWREPPKGGQASGGRVE